MDQARCRGATGRWDILVGMDELSKLAGVVATFVAAVGGPAVLAHFMRSMFPNERERLRLQITQNAELLDKLPENSSARALLTTAIEKDLCRLTVDLSGARRDPVSTKEECG